MNLKESLDLDPKTHGRSELEWGPAESARTGQVQNHHKQLQRFCGLSSGFYGQGLRVQGERQLEHA